MEITLRNPGPNKIVTSDPDIPPNSDEADGYAEVAERAYNLWRARGSPLGDDQADWFKAEHEVRDGRGSRKPS